MSRDAATPGATFRFQLFVAGNEAKSVLARENLRRLCEEHLPGRHEITVIDVLADYRKALEANVLLTPAVRLIEPAPAVTLFGTLADRERVLDALRLGVTP